MDYIVVTVQAANPVDEERIPHWDDEHTYQRVGSFSEIINDYFMDKIVQKHYVEDNNNFPTIRSIREFYQVSKKNLYSFRTPGAIPGSFKTLHRLTDAQMLPADHYPRDDQEDNQAPPPLNPAPPAVVAVGNNVPPPPAVVAVDNNVPGNVAPPNIAPPAVDVDDDNVRGPNAPPVGIIPYVLAEQIARAQPFPAGGRRSRTNNNANNNANNELADDPIDESEAEELTEEVAGAPPRRRRRMNNP